ncbi:MAG: 2-C-methyl-D-erythritol 4-phosphate cytidylyltransferase, partial [Pseudolabrys sp.]|nr:2-C-methyl-D-erythritol 4-phosphate cytidylyltransferase [Pseudolabrys sp.]
MPEMRYIRVERARMSQVAVVIVAAGRGDRAGPGVPKQYRSVGGTSALNACLATFGRHTEIRWVQPVIHPDDEQLFTAGAAGVSTLRPVHGSATRQGSVRAGLQALESQKPDIVLIHDAARPFVSATLVSRAIAAARATNAAVPALAVTDTIKMVDRAGRIERTIERAAIRAVQTPQAFAFAPIYEAHQKAAAAGRDDFTDDAALAEWAGLNVTVFDGELSNIKLTTPVDFQRAEFHRLGDVRMGSGIDVHAFAPGDHVTLGGIRIPH